MALTDFWTHRWRRRMARMIRERGIVQHHVDWGPKGARLSEEQQAKVIVRMWRDLDAGRFEVASDDPPMTGRQVDISEILIPAQRAAEEEGRPPPPPAREGVRQMAETSKIEWTDATWNPITGCTVISPGCTHCYAMKLAGTRLAHLPSRAGLTIDTKAGPVWTGEVRFNEQWLADPLRWRRPRMIFVCAHGDLFHEAVPDEWIDRVFAVMALASWHTFQVLTKRPARMRAYMTDGRLRARIYEAADHMAGHGSTTDLWPLPNVWLGVSAEDQQRADERIPHLLATPAAVRWVSAEPLLGAMDLGPYLSPHFQSEDANYPKLGELDWVVVGGESGQGARRMDLAWDRSLQQQCQAAGVPFFRKQLGVVAARELGLRDKKGGDMTEWPVDLRVREMPHAAR